jgi:hypothetical protein
MTELALQQLVDHTSPIERVKFRYVETIMTEEQLNIDIMGQEKYDTMKMIFPHGDRGLPPVFVMMIKAEREGQPEVTFFRKTYVVPAEHGPITEDDKSFGREQTMNEIFNYGMYTCLQHWVTMQIREINKTGI